MTFQIIIGRMSLIMLERSRFLLGENSKVCLKFAEKEMNAE
jgi:hypothetical protein